jgi:hypothetical protein
MQRNLAHVQEAFAGALADPLRTIPEGLLGPSAWDAGRFAIYRNNIAVSLTEALVSHFPVCHRIVGDRFFTWIAQEFVAGHKPATPLLMSYGDDLPAFIESFEPAGDVPYLADMARLELAWIRAYHSLEQVPLGVEALKPLSLKDLMAARMVLHPSAQLVRSSYPIATIWAMHQPDNEPVALQECEDEQVLVLRPAAEVLMHRLPAGGAVFLSAIEGNEPIGRSGELALVDSPEFDFGSSLVNLFAAGAVIKILLPDGSQAQQ